MRICGECSLCCKLPGVYTAPDQYPKISKPPNQWCAHCLKPGCGIYDTRPQPCRNFSCLWLVHEEMAEELRPDRSHVVIYALPEDGRENSAVIAMEDPDYYRQGESLTKPSIRHIVDINAASGRQVLVINGNKADQAPGSH